MTFRKSRALLNTLYDLSGPSEPQQHAASSLVNHSPFIACYMHSNTGHKCRPTSKATHEWSATVPSDVGNPVTTHKKAANCRQYMHRNVSDITVQLYAIHDRHRPRSRRQPSRSTEFGAQLGSEECRLLSVWKYTAHIVPTRCSGVSQYSTFVKGKVTRSPLDQNRAERQQPSSGLVLPHSQLIQGTVPHFHDQIEQRQATKEHRSKPCLRCSQPT
jgi:hypothetical protein